MTPFSESTRDSLHTQSRSRLAARYKDCRRRVSPDGNGSRRSASRARRECHSDAPLFQTSPGHPVKHGNANSVPPQQVTVERANIERDVVQPAGASYVRITITDHTRPLDDEVDRFILAVSALPENAWAHFHCEAGLGRTTTFMALYDMLRNASRMSLEDIVYRQKILSHGYDVLQPDEPENWKAPYAAKRAEFIRAFYGYARANPNGRPRVWSGWLKASKQ